MKKLLILLMLGIITFSSYAQENSEYIAEMNIENIEVKFLEAKKTGDQIVLKALFTSKNEDVEIELLGDKKSKLYDDLGNVYSYTSKSTSIGNTKNNAYGIRAKRTLISDIPTPVSFSFSKVKQTPTIIPKLVLEVWLKNSGQNGWKTYDVRNIPMTK